MPPFRDEQILMIAPGSQVTLAQLGLPESYTPAVERIRSCMFPGEKVGEFEPFKVRRKDSPKATTNGEDKPAGQVEDEHVYEEDHISEDGAVWPIRGGRIVDWPCFFALLTYLYDKINPPFHTAILLVAEPVWTPKDHERITSFVFEKFKSPAFQILDSATATCYALGVQSATVIDIGRDKADITAVSEFVAHDTGRSSAIPACGGEAMTQQLLRLLSVQGLTREMCEQLKKSPICEILPLDAQLPISTPVEPPNPAAQASTGANGPGTANREGIGAGNEPRGPGEGTEVGVEMKDVEDNEGVLDIASIVTGGNMNEFLERKEKERVERAAVKKKGADVSSTAQKPARLPNSKRYKNTFTYEDHALRNALKDMNVNGKRMAEMQAAMDGGSNKRQKTPEPGEEAAGAGAGAAVPATNDHANGVNGETGTMRREIEVGPERFEAVGDGLLERLADAVYRTVSAVEELSRRSELWESLVVLGNGSKVRGFKDALVAKLHSKYLISPSSATMFTSELPSNLSTPLATGMNTPQPQMIGQQHPGSQVNPLLLAATTAQNPHLHPMSHSVPGMPPQQHSHISHGQTPTSIKLAKYPDYFPEWKDHGYEEAAFLGAQVAAKVFFTVDSGLNKGYMTRTEYNESGPQVIHDCSI